MKIGMGFDIHQLKAGLPLHIGGITIPSERGAIAHSDGDVLLHALCDALLGAIGEGDIGTLFPDTDPAFKNAKSERFVEAAHSLIRRRHFAIENIDATVFLEHPKLLPHRNAIQESIMDMLALPKGLHRHKSQDHRRA